MMSVIDNSGIGSIKKQIFLGLGLLFSCFNLGAMCPQTVGSISINEGIWNVLTRIGQATNVIESQICALGTPSSGGGSDFTCTFTFGQVDIGGGNIYTISVPGTYCMSENVTFSFGTAIRVASSDVTIDLQGHTLNGANEALSVAGIRLENFISNVTIQNGTIENISGTTFFAIRDSGVAASTLDAALSNVVIKDINFNNNFSSIGLGVVPAEQVFLDGILIENCNFFGTLAPDVQLLSISSIVRNCRLQNAFQILAPGVPAGTFYALVEDLIISNTNTSQVGIIDVQADNVVVRNCLVQGPSNQGIAVNGSAVTISDCTIQGGDISLATNGLNLVTGRFAAAASAALIERCYVADSSGFSIDFAGNSLKLVDCVAEDNAFDGFNVTTGLSIIFERCSAQISNLNGFVAQINGIGAGGPEDIIFNDCQAVGNGVCGFLLVTPSGSLGSLTSAAFNRCIAQANAGDGFNLDNITGFSFANVSFNDCVAQDTFPGGRTYGTSTYPGDGFGVNSASNGGRTVNSTINNVVFTNCVAQSSSNNGFNFGDAANNVDTISCQYCTSQQNVFHGMNFSSTSTNCEVYMCLLVENGLPTTSNGINNLNANFGPLPSSANSFLSNQSYNNGLFDYFQINDGTNGQPFFSRSTEASVQGASAWANMAT